ncbi:biotin/lipoyl-binding protein, partial [Acinetobacter baumannii]
VSGQLKKVHVEIGDRVQKGQLLAEIDPAVYKAQVDSGRANLDNLKAQLQQQEAELELANQQNARSQRLLAARAVSQDEAEQAASG